MGHIDDRVIYVRGAFENREQSGRRSVWERMSRGMIWVLLFLMSIVAWIGLIAAGWQLLEMLHLIGS